MKKIIWTFVFVVFFGFLSYFVFVSKTQAPVMLDQAPGKASPSETLPSVASPPSGTEEVGKPALKLVDFAQFDAAFRFRTQIPAAWEVEYISQPKAISLFNPTVPGENIREKSQIFITRFDADRFLTLSTVTLTRNEKTNINGHEATLYELTNNSGVPNFSHQPSWRNQTHRATDIRFANTSPSPFYPFAANPKLSGETFENVIQSVRFHNDQASFEDVLPDIAKREIKKPFGLFVTPQTSPVQPEFFSGYHTAVDYEILEGEEEKDVPVFALCGGPLRAKQKVSGYGGVAVQECLLGDEVITVVYGHLFLTSITPAQGAYLIPGAQIGLLAPAGPEAGGGRKHLHLGIHKGKGIDIKGYVQKESELGGWLDPKMFLEA